MDSSSKPEVSKESSTTIPTKSGDSEHQKDSQHKAPSKVGAGLLSTGGTPSTTAPSGDSTKSVVSTSQSSSTTTSTTTSSASQSVTISLGVGGFQVGKTLYRVPSPPKATSTTTASSQDVTSSISTTSSTTSTSSTSGGKDLVKTVQSSSSTGNLFSTTAAPDTKLSTTTSVASSTESSKPKPSQSTSGQNQPSLSGSVSSPVVTEATPAPTGGALSSSAPTTTAMKRPQPDSSAAINIGPVSTVSSADTDSGTEHKRKKMRKENRERSDSPGTGRLAKSGGSKQGSPSSTVSSTDGSEKSSGKSETTITQEKQEESKPHPFEAFSSTTATTTSGNGLPNVTTSTNSSTTSTHSTTAGGPKVPPLKIVLQSHSNAPATTATTTSSTATTTSMPLKTAGSSSSENPNSQAPSGTGQGTSGFPYVVSSSTDAGSSSSPGTSENTSTNTKPTPAAGPTTESGNKIPHHHHKAKATGGSSTEPPSTNVSTTSATLDNVNTPATNAAPPTQAPFSTLASTVNSATADSSKDKSEGSPTPDTASNNSNPHSKDDGEHKNDSPSPMDTSGPSTTGANNPLSGNEHDKDKDSMSATKDKDGKDGSSAPKEKEKPVRVTRSSQRILKEGGGTHTPNSPSSSSPKTSACPSPSHSHQGDSQGPAEVGPVVKQQPSASGDGTEKMDTSEVVDLHPRKRKIRNKDKEPASKEKEPKESKDSPAPSTSAAAPVAVPATNHHHSSVPPPEPMDQQQGSSSASNEQPMLNCFEMYLNIRKQIDRRRRNLFPVTPKPPKGFKDYLMNRGTYILAGNANALAVSLLNPPPTLTQQMKDFFSEQEKERHKLRLQHLVEKEKLVLSVEQEILRVHGRAARALSNQTLPFSVCTILKDQEVYNLLTPEQEEKDINARSRYNGRLFLSWLQDVDDKWDKIKEYMLLRHHNEAESLHAVQKMDWEWKLKEYGLCEHKATPIIDDISVPMVHVSDDFDLLPA